MEWPRSTPEALGVDPVRLARFLETVMDEGLPVHGVLVVRQGTVDLDAAFHPFGPDDLHDVASVTKSITGTLVGIALARARGRWETPGELRIEIDELGLISRWSVSLRFHGEMVSIDLDDASGNSPMVLDGVLGPVSEPGGPVPL